MAARSRTIACGLGTMGLVIAINVWTATYVASERTIYTWDWASYWRMFQGLGRLLRIDPAAAFGAIEQSIMASESNVLPVLPLMPFALLFGPGRLSYILAITDMAVLPGALLMAWIAERAIRQERRSWPRVLVCTAAILCLHVLWAPALRGLPDAVGVTIACLILRAYDGGSTNKRVLKLVGIGLMLCLLILTRRYYLFWAASFFPAALIGQLVVQQGSAAGIAAVRSLMIIGIACAAFLLILAAPLIGHIATTDYGVAYAAYRSDLGGAGQVAAHFGLALLAVCGAGLLILTIHPATRSLGILLLVQAVLAFVLFTHVQALFGVHHFYIFVPAAGIGLAAAIITLWEANIWRGWRIAGIAGIFAVVLASSSSVFAPTSPQLPLLPSVRYAPLTRPDLAEVRRLLTTLAMLKPVRIYVAASAQEFNSATLAMGCQDIRPALCPHIATTQDIDTRDGFPIGILDADYVVLATPTQYHVHPQDQRVVGRVADAIRAGQGIGASFRRLPGGFALAQGVNVTLYRQITPLNQQAVQALSDALARDHPGMGRLFAPPRSATITLR